MVLGLIGKIFDFLVGGPRDSGPRDEPEEHHGRLSPTTAVLPVDGARPMDNTPLEETSRETEGIYHPNQQDLFQWILLLLRLVTTVRLGSPVWKPKPEKAESVSRFHTQSYGHLDALTTLLLRRDEIVAAVESSPGSGFIMSDDKSTGMSDDKSTGMSDDKSTGAESEESEVDPEFYDIKCSFPPSVQITGIANPEHGCSHGTRCNEVKVLNFGSKGLWEDLKKNPYHYLTVTLETRQDNQEGDQKGKQKGKRGYNTKEKNKYSAPRVNVETHLETIRSYLNEYKTLPEEKRKDFSRVFVKFILTSCWPKMYRRVHGWSSLSLIKQLCAIDRDAIQDLSSKFEQPLVQPDVALLHFLQSGWDLYLPKLLDHHPDVKARSTGRAPLPQKLLDAIISQGSYTYSTDVAIDFHNLLTSSLIAYAVRLDYVNRALRKLNGKKLPDPGAIGPLFDVLSIAVRAVFALSHSKAMAAHMNMLSSSVKLPKDQDASDSLSFISDLIENHCQRSEEAKGLAPYLKPLREGRKNSGRSNGQDGSTDGPSSHGAVSGNGQISQEDDSGDKWEDDQEDEPLASELTTPEPVVYRRWIMSLVDHFTSIRILERACVKLPESTEINFSLLGVDRREAKLPDWKTMETIVRQLTSGESALGSKKFITDLKAYIENYGSGGSIPGTAARQRDSVILPFQDQLKPDPNRSLKPGPPVITTCLHCEATLVAVMAYLAGDPKHGLAPLLQIREDCVYKISVSKSCCPVCWALVDIINTTSNPKNIKFQVRARHSTLYLVDLPSFLPVSIQDQLIAVFKKKLQSEIIEAMRESSAGSKMFRPAHKSKEENRSFESIASAMTVSTEGGSVDCEAAVKEHYEPVSTEGGSVDCEAAVKEQ